MRYFLLALLLLPMNLMAQEYMLLSDFEHPANAPNQILVFTGRDSLWGPVHSNDWIATQNVNGLPVFYDVVSTTRPSFRPGSPNPAGQFFGGPPVFNAPAVEFPDELTFVREEATSQGNFLSVPGHEWTCVIDFSHGEFYHYPTGTPADTFGVPARVDFGPRTVVFVDGKLDLRGVLEPSDYDIIIGCNQDVRLIDNLMLDGTNMTNGYLPPDATSRLAVASEQGIVVGNTWRNGRENCSGPGSMQERCHIVITAFLVALGTGFQFEQMNDVDDPYVSPVSPDERGNIVLNGAIAQRYRGYVHRSNLGGTGYNKVYHWDTRMRYWSTGIFEPYRDMVIPDSLLFEDTPVGDVTWDTVRFVGDGPFSGALATYPFATNAGYQFNGPDFAIPVSFTPPHAGPYFGTLSFFLAGQYHSIALRGNGVSGAPPIAPEIYPNPFNNVTSLSFTLPEAAHVRATVYDVLGREVARLADEAFIAGQHRLAVNAAAWSSGVYFLRLETLGQIETRKMLLIK